MFIVVYPYMFAQTEHGITGKMPDMEMMAESLTGGPFVLAEAVQSLDSINVGIAMP